MKNASLTSCVIGLVIVLVGSSISYFIESPLYSALCTLVAGVMSIFALLASLKVTFLKPLNRQLVALANDPKSITKFLTPELEAIAHRAAKGDSIGSELNTKVSSNAISTAEVSFSADQIQIQLDNQVKDISGIS
ncbi:MAG: hypothetical protein ACPGPF_07795, partial [Pontibacterium sp.]